MPFVGCSIGDIIAVFTLIINAVEALNDCCGSSAEYHKLEMDFATTHRILRVMKQKILATEQDDPDVAELLYTITLRVNGLMECFRTSIGTKYEALSIPGKKGWKYVVRALQWGLCEKKRILAFKGELAALKQDLQLSLQCMNHTNY